MTILSTTNVIASPTRRTQGRAIAAGVIGNILEWYDFSIYIFLVPVLSRLFFPTGERAAALLLSLAIFGSGFVMRPVGAVFFGAMGDKHGRRYTLAVVMFLTAISTFLIGCLPTYSSAGITATILLTVLRLVQGFATGGEWTGSASFVIEYAPSNRRGLYGGFHVAGLGIGLLLGSVTANLLSTHYSQSEVLAWAWRIPFWLAILAGMVGAVIRWRLNETPAFTEAKVKGNIAHSPLREALINYRTLLKAFCLVTFTAASSYVLLTYMPTYLSVVVKMPMADALRVNSICMILLCFSLPALGLLSDVIGRRRQMAVGCVMFIVLAIPAFRGITHGSFTSVLFWQLALTLAYAIYGTVIPVACVEMFSTKARLTGFSISYNFAQTLFGGFGPFVVQALISSSGMTIAPAFYMLAAAAVSLGTLLFLKETAFSTLE